MSSQQNKIIYVATNIQLNDPHYYKRLWLATRNTPIPRRDWLDAIADTLRDFDGEILLSTRLPYEIPCIDTTFGDDPDTRWLGHFMESNGSDDMPLRKTRKMERLRLIDLYFRIQHPEIARHFSL